MVKKRKVVKYLQEIEMTPTDKNKAFHKVYLLVDKKLKTSTAQKCWKRMVTSIHIQ